jgi:hypothetical protein
VHDENAIRRQAVDLSILLPLRRLLLQGTVQSYKDAQLMQMSAVSFFFSCPKELPDYADG